jgi:hypothetical protein
MSATASTIERIAKADGFVYEGKLGRFV